MDTLVTPGFYYTANGIDPANHPDITNYQNALVIIYTSRSDLVIQFWIAYNDLNHFIYMRKGRVNNGSITNENSGWKEFIHREKLYISTNLSHYNNITDYILDGAVTPNRNTSGYVKLAFPLAWRGDLASTSYNMLTFDFIYRVFYTYNNDPTMTIPIHGYCHTYQKYNPSTGDLVNDTPPNILLVSEFSAAKLATVSIYYRFEELPIYYGGTCKFLCFYFNVGSYTVFNINNIMYNDNIINNNLLDDLKITKIEDGELPLDVTEIAYSYTNTTKKTI